MNIGCSLRVILKGLLPVIVAVVLILLTKQANANALQYGQKNLVNVEWGAKAGKFGLAIPEEGELVGPRTFTVDQEGNIHIFDSIKKNIKVFGADGVFKKSVGKNLPGYSLVAHNHSYFLLDGDAIHQYSFSGTPIHTFPVVSAIHLREGYGQWMQRDANGHLYVKSQGKTYRICEQKGQDMVALSDDAQIQSARRGAPDAGGTRWHALTKESLKLFRLRLFDQAGNPAGEFPVETTETFGSVIFLDADKNGIIYLEIKRMGADGVARLEVRAYQPDGRLIFSTDLPNKYYTNVYKKVMVDQEGNIYQMQTAPSGVKIIKWSKP